MSEQYRVSQTQNKSSRDAKFQLKKQKLQMAMLSSQNLMLNSDILDPKEVPSDVQLPSMKNRDTERCLRSSRRRSSVLDTDRGADQVYAKTVKGDEFIAQTGIKSPHRDDKNRAQSLSGAAQPLFQYQEININNYGRGDGRQQPLGSIPSQFSHSLNSFKHPPMKKSMQQFQPGEIYAPSALPSENPRTPVTPFTPGGNFNFEVLNNKDDFWVVEEVPEAPGAKELAMRRKKNMRFSNAKVQNLNHSYLPTPDKGSSALEKIARNKRLDVLNQSLQAPLRPLNQQAYSREYHYGKTDAASRVVDPDENIIIKQDLIKQQEYIDQQIQYKLEWINQSLIQRQLSTNEQLVNQVNSLQNQFGQLEGMLEDQRGQGGSARQQQQCQIEYLNNVVTEQNVRIEEANHKINQSAAEQRELQETFSGLARVVKEQHSRIEGLMERVTNLDGINQKMDQDCCRYKHDIHMLKGEIALQKEKLSEVHCQIEAPVTPVLRQVSQIFSQQSQLLNNDITRQQKLMKKAFSTYGNNQLKINKFASETAERNSVDKKSQQMNEMIEAFAKANTQTPIGQQMHQSAIQKMESFFCGDEKHAHSQICKERPDLIYLYSQPLVDQIVDEQGVDKMIPHGCANRGTDHVYSNLVRILQSAEKEFQIERQCANQETLKRMEQLQPAIVHIQCCGDFDQEKKEFYLQFEKSGIGESGIAEKFHQSKLKELFGKRDSHQIQFAFVQACQSEEIGKVLMNCGIPVVVAVNGEQGKVDAACDLFSEHFYKKLLQGTTVRKAFEEAEKLVQKSGNVCNSCCCAHAHNSKCKWQMYANQVGYEKAHELHSEKCNCSMPLNRHKNNCAVYLDFKRFLREYKDPEKCVNMGHEHEDIWAIDDDCYLEHMVPLQQTDEEVHQNILCCCQTETPHDESVKFMLKMDPQYESLILFQERQKGQLIQAHEMNLTNRISNSFDDQMLIGRNLDVQQCVSLLTGDEDTRLIQIKGEHGVGKSAIGGHAIKYCLERNFFEDGAYQIDMDQRNTCEGFVSLLYQAMRLEPDSLDDLIEIIQQSHIVLFLRGCNSVITNEGQKFTQLLANLLDKTQNLVILMVTDDGIQIELPEKYQDVLRVQCLDKYSAAKLFKSFDKDNQIIQQHPDELMNNPIFDTPLTDSKLYEIYLLLEKFKDLSKVASMHTEQLGKQQKDEEDPKTSETNVQWVMYNQMNQRFPLEKKVFFIMCQFPGGLSMNDLENIISDNEEEYGEWKEFVGAMVAQNAIFIKNDRDSQQVYQVRKQIKEFIMTKIIPKEEPLKGCKNYYFYVMLKYLSRIGRHLVKNLQQRSPQDFHLNIFSPQIDQGLFGKPQQQDDYKFGNLETGIKSKSYDELIGKFQNMQENFTHILNYEVVTGALKQFFSEYPPDLEQMIGDAYTTYAALMILCDKKEEYIQNALHKGVKICTELEFNKALFKLSIMSTSLNIQYKQTDFESIDTLLNDGDILLKTTDKEFQDLGRPELKLLQQIWCIYQHSLKKEAKKEREEIQNMIDNCLRKPLKYQSISSYDQIRADLENPKLQSIDRYLYETQNFYKKQSLQYKTDLCEARLILIKAKFYFGCFPGNMEKQKECLDDLLQATKVFAEYGFFRHQVRCLYFIANLYVYDREYMFAKKMVHEAIHIAQEVHDYDQLRDARELLNHILLQVQVTANNQVVYLNAYPLVDVQGGRMTGLHQYNVCTREYEGHMIYRFFNQIGKDIKLQYDTLNRQNLENLRDYGCRILVISSSKHDDAGNICLEGNNGEIEKMTVRELEELLQPQNGNFKVDAVFVNIDKGKRIAKVFQNLGVPQIFTFSQDEFYSCTEGRQIAGDMIKRLIEEQTFQKAFENTTIQLDKDRNEKTLTFHWYSGQTSNPDDKLFDNTSIDIRRQIARGKVEDQTKSQGLTNITDQYLIMYGRQLELHKLINFITNPNYNFINFNGPLIDEKTKILKQLARFLALRNTFRDGVFYHNFNSVTTALEAANYFLKNSLDLVNAEILFIFDNIDGIEKNDPSFKWHLDLLLKKSNKIKIIVAKQNEYQEGSQSSTKRMVQITLQPLSSQSEAENEAEEEIRLFDQLQKNLHWRDTIVKEMLTARGMDKRQSVGIGSLFGMVVNTKIARCDTCDPTMKDCPHIDEEGQSQSPSDNKSVGNLMEDEN